MSNPVEHLYQVENQLLGKTRIKASSPLIACMSFMNNFYPLDPEKEVYTYTSMRGNPRGATHKVTLLDGSKSSVTYFCVRQVPAKKPVAKKNTFKVNCWIHAHYTVEVEAKDMDEAVSIAESGGGRSQVNFRGLAIGDSGVTSVELPNGKTEYLE